MAQLNPLIAMTATPPRKNLLAHLRLQPAQRIDVELQAEQATGSITNFIGLLAANLLSETGEAVNLLQ
jgi:hypothetical protein